MVGVAAVAVGLSAWAAGGDEAEPCVEAPASDEGTFAVTMGWDERTDVYVVRADDTLTRVSGESGGFLPAWSPDGTRIAYVTDGPPNDGNPQRDIWIAGCGLEAPEPLITGVADDTDPAWSPDGTKIAFTSMRDGLPAIFVADADGNNVRQLTDGGDRGDSQPAWSPDGTTIAYASNRLLGFQYMGAEASADDVYVVSADGGMPRPVARGLQPKWSPDGTKIAFRSSKTFGATYRLVDLDGSSELVISGDEYSTAPIVAPGYPMWRPFTARGLDVPLCVKQPEDGREVCFDNNWWDGISWTPHANSLS